MRLINTATLALETFTSSTPPYAILSHTWQDDEVSMADMAAIDESDDPKFSKIRGICAEAGRIGLRYAWVDTCCIDKSSSAELSEAINSMFEWYRAADVCFCLLSDFQPGSSPDEDLEKCRWFTRGWTLQELIAPDVLVFFDSSWTACGSMRLRKSHAKWPLQYHEDSYEIDLSGRVSDITGVPLSVLSSVSVLHSTPAVEIMSWASMRTTTRIEDRAYSLLGLLDVNLPLLYGERSKAFTRLQEEVLRKRGDLSLLAWAPSGGCEPTTEYFGILAPSPKEFAWCRGHQVSQPARHNTEVSVTHRGLRLSSKLILSEVSPSSFLYFFDLEMMVRAHKVIASMSFDEIHDNLFGRRKSVGILPKVPTRQLTGIHLRKYGPSVFYRDGHGSSPLTIESNATRELPRATKTTFYISSASTINEVARDHPFADRILQSAHFLDHSAGHHISTDATRHLHESCRRSGFRVPEDARKMILDHVVHGDLWDWAEEAFIPSVSDNPGWDAVVFYPAVSSGDVSTDGIVLLVYSFSDLEQFPPRVLLLDKSDEEVSRLLNNATKIKMNDLMRDFPGIRNKIYNASGVRVRYLTKLERQQDSPEVPQSWHTWDADWQRSGPDVFVSRFLRLTTKNWDVEAEIHRTPAVEMDPPPPWKHVPGPRACLRFSKVVRRDVPTTTGQEPYRSIALGRHAQPEKS
ncbi:heterokaryon incompatibility protein-domain-containing protein [Podospora aff. communis PSN243]|uniref:Heterokaryon incompatibility protein-domain-containing protein n=1 Tax=Podospora aff. communis PSN243 TaxID=3040156 RepID=A0AAV9GBP2_9PEZI|nr:heterokaryon incompatibility protein-domain-containing protein [Podospora aff. communis PSN243]